MQHPNIVVIVEIDTVGRIISIGRNGFVSVGTVTYPQLQVIHPGQIGQEGLLVHSPATTGRPEISPATVGSESGRSIPTERSGEVILVGKGVIQTSKIRNECRFQGRRTNVKHLCGNVQFIGEGNIIAFTGSVEVLAHKFLKFISYQQIDVVLIGQILIIGQRSRAQILPVFTAVLIGTTAIGFGIPVIGIPEIIGIPVEQLTADLGIETPNRR